MTTLLTIQRVADVLKGVVSESTPDDTAVRLYENCVIVGKGLDLSWSMDSSAPFYASAMIIKSAILNKFARITAVSALASSRGYVLPDDPSIRLTKINARRQLWQTVEIGQEEAEKIISEITELSAVTKAYDDGKLTFDRPNPSFQISTFEISVDGISKQTGDALADILGYQPDGDFIKRKQSLDSLAKLDFSKRKPYLLFTADTIKDGKRTGGTILCWMRMHDASGYTISKSDVFAETKMPDIVLSNDSLKASTANLMTENDFVQVLSFYDWLHPGDFLAFRDDSTIQNTLYSYEVSGIQRKAPATLSLFDVKFNDLYISPSQASDIKGLINAEMAKFALAPDKNSISPYPSIAQVVYGDPGYGWILAGCNLLASKRRGETFDQNRSLSFIGSNIDYITIIASAGKFVAPSDVSALHDIVDSSIQSFGISQTILSILDGTGATFFISGKDDPSGLQSPTQMSLEKASGGLARILGVIDPESATINPTKLIAALSAGSTSGKGVWYAPKYIASPKPPIADVNVSTPVIFATSIQSAIGTDIIDMTTYEGISRFMNLLRLIYDFYPGAFI